LTLSRVQGSLTLPARSTHRRLTVLRAQPRPSLWMLQRLFGSENAAVAHRLDVKLEVALLAKQPEAVADFPGNLDGAVWQRR
jgi:hypothetical protein